MTLGEGGPHEREEQEGQTQAWLIVSVTLLRSQDGATQLTCYAIEMGRFWCLYINLA